MHGVVRDDLRLQHPELVPYAQLSDPVQEYDRDAVRRVPHLLRVTKCETKWECGAGLDHDVTAVRKPR